MSTLGEAISFYLPGLVQYCIQWSPSGEARNVSLKLRNLIHIQAPFFTNHVYFTLHGRPPLLKGHHFRWPLWRGFTVFNKYCVCWWTGNLIRVFFSPGQHRLFVVVLHAFVCVCLLKALTRSAKHDGKSEVLKQQLKELETREKERIEEER